MVQMTQSEDKQATLHLEDYYPQIVAQWSLCELEHYLRISAQMLSLFSG